MNVLNQVSVMWMHNGFFRQPWRFPPLARVTFGQKADEDGCGMAAVCVCVRVRTSVWSPSVAEQEGSCVITHSTALTSSINSSQILITCFQDVALPL